MSPVDEKWWVEFWGALEEEARPESEVMLDSIAAVEITLLGHFFPESAQLLSS